MIHLALPRDLVVPIFVGWLWVGFWTSSVPRVDLIDEWLGDVLRGWMGLPERPRSRLERYRNGWTFFWATVIALGLGVLCYVMPWVWL